MRRSFTLGFLLTLPLITWAEPMILARSLMNVTEGRYDFASVTSVELSLLSNNGMDPTNIAIAFNSRSHILEITNMDVDDNGCTKFYAVLPRSSEHDDQYRLSVSLLCDYGCRQREQPSNADVAEGYGFCGTMDSVMHLEGYLDWR